MSNNFEQGQKIANQEIDKKYKNNILYNGGPGSGVKGHTTAGDEGGKKLFDLGKSVLEKYKTEKAFRPSDPFKKSGAELGTTDVNNFKGGSISFRTEGRPKAGERNVVTVSATEKGDYDSRKWVSKPGRKLTSSDWDSIRDYQLKQTKPETTAHISKK